MPDRIRNALFPILMIVAGIVLILGSAAWFVNAQRPEAEVSQSAPAMRIPHPDIPRITVEDAKAVFDAGSAAFIDTRGEPYFSQGHIPGALSITVDELPDRIDELRDYEWIVTYCT
jgi:hypothetical protein